jgi:hypothetical protein
LYEFYLQKLSASSRTIQIKTQKFLLIKQEKYGVEFSDVSNERLQKVLLENK